MGPKKKKVKGVFNPYTIIEYSHPYPHVPLNMQESSIWISFDPGTSNPGFRIARRTNTPTGARVETLVSEKGFFRSNFSARNTFLYNDIVSFFSRFENYYQQSHAFVVEKQLKKSRAMCAVMDFAIAYFAGFFAKLNHKPWIFVVDSKLKGQYLGVPSGTDRDVLKGITVERAILLSERRGDYMERIHLSSMSPIQARDLADVLIQIEALCKVLGLPLTEGTQNNTAMLQCNPSIPSFFNQ